MKLQPILLSDWPKLAWVACCGDRSGEVRVLHGPMVETAEDWIAEAVWDGNFPDGDFDRTDLVFGSGVRLRGEQVVFVSSGTVFDRLVYLLVDNVLHVSNSLPALLAVTGHDLREDYLNYSEDIRSIMRGLSHRVRTIPTTGPDFLSVFFHNLVWSDGRLQEQDKPDTAPRFDSYESYRRFLDCRADRIGRNARDPHRRHAVRLLSSISSGYDSAATSVIARRAGCDQTVTIADSTSLWRGRDTGKPIADILGMSCVEYPRTAKSYPLEEAFWAAEGRVGILNWAQFHFPEPLCLFFTGCHGEKMWDRVTHDHPDPFIRRDPSSLGFCEFRLLRGVFQCVVPFWGVRHCGELKSITLSDEMRPWYMNRDHDKPIARRILESEGVPRRMFGLLNKNTSLESRFRWPFSPAARTSFARFLEQRGIRVPSPARLGFMRGTDRLYTLFHANLPSFLRGRLPRLLWRRDLAQSLIFQWANHQLQARYAAGLVEARMV